MPDIERPKEAEHSQKQEKGRVLAYTAWQVLCC